MLRTLPMALLLAATVGGTAACTPELPDKESPEAQLYVARCAGECHAPHHPRGLTAMMWVSMVDRMEQEIAKRGQPPLTDRERQTILDYLTRHAHVPDPQL